MMRMVTALLIIVAAATAAAWAQTDPAEITPHAAPKAPAEAAPADTAGPPPAALAAVIFKSSCGRCHGSDRPAVGLSLRPENFADATIDVPSKEVQELKLVDTKNPEKSYLVPTPFGEMVDVLLSSAADETLAAYPVILLVGDMTFDARFAAQLRHALRKGSKLLLHPRHAEALAVL